MEKGNLNNDIVLLRRVKSLGKDSWKIVSDKLASSASRSFSLHPDSSPQAYDASKDETAG